MPMFAHWDWGLSQDGGRALQTASTVPLMQEKEDLNVLAIFQRPNMLITTCTALLSKFTA